VKVSAFREGEVTETDIIGSPGKDILGNKKATGKKPRTNHEKMPFHDAKNPTNLTCCSMRCSFSLMYGTNVATAMLSDALFLFFCSFTT
jgi:hypothetical protein